MSAVTPEKVRVGDVVEVAMLKHRNVNDKVRARSVVHVLLTGPDSEIKYEEWGENLITDYGDEHLAVRIFDDTALIVTGMRLGTGVAAATKAGAGSFIGTYISGSNEDLDGVATDTDKGAGSGHRATHVCTWIAGDVTNGAISEFALSDETPLTDVQGTAINTIARFVPAATIDKQSGDQLVVTWHIDILGA
jgi:hypothetical protein